MRYDGKEMGKYTRNSYTPFHVEIGDSHSGFRLGGMPPAHANPSFNSPLTRYFLTAPVSSDYECSIFYSFDFDSDGDANPFDMAYTMFGSDNKLVEVCFHEPSCRRGRAEISSDLPPLKLVCGKVCSEGAVDEAGCYPYHKIGGMPFFTHEFNSGISQSCERLLNEGFVQLLQFAFPVGPNDALINADWPFGEAVFHVFAKYDDGGFLYKYCWG